MKGKELVIEHGIKYLPFIDERVSRDLIPKTFAQYTLDYESFLIRTFGTALINEIYKKYNQEIKGKIPEKLKNNEILVCGHTHLAEVDLKNNFVNGGLTNYGLGQYLLLENDEIILKEYWYDAPKLEELIEPQLYTNYTKEIDPDSVK